MLEGPAEAAQARLPGHVAGQQLAIELARVLSDTRCHNGVVLDVSGISPVTDYLVLASGTSPRQMKSAADAAEEVAEPVGSPTLSRVGDESGQWIVMDLFDVVVHVFSDDARIFYDLDNLWGDARRLKWQRDEPVAPVVTPAN